MNRISIEELDEIKARILARRNSHQDEVRIESALREAYAEVDELHGELEKAVDNWEWATRTDMDYSEFVENKELIKEKRDKFSLGTKICEKRFEK